MTCAASANAELVVYCPWTKKVLGGGLRVGISLDDAEKVKVLSSHPDGDNAWRVRVTNEAWFQDYSVTVYAVCASAS
jgi:hypothetical protein